jgi:outer membrane lipoprotein-sorting protein
MKKILMLLLMLCALMPGWSQQDTQTRKILETTSTRISGDSGIRAKFRLRTYRRKALQGELQGEIAMKGNRFVLTTPDSQTWFNGKTQWTYLSRNEEMNISNPTAEELRSINPYAYLSLYKQGYNYRSKAVTYQGKSAYQVTLTPQKKADIAYLILWVATDTYQVLRIQVNSSTEDYMLIDPTSYKQGQALSDATFRPDLKSYPNAEIIDLR